MEVDLQSLFGLHVTWCAQLYSLAETPQLPPSPHLDSYTRALLVSQDRRHLFVTPWYQYYRQRINQLVAFCNSYISLFQDPELTFLWPFLLSSELLYFVCNTFVNSFFLCSLLFHNFLEQLSTVGQTSSISCSSWRFFCPFYCVLY